MGAVFVKVTVHLVDVSCTSRIIKLTGKLKSEQKNMNDGLSSQRNIISLRKNAKVVCIIRSMSFN